MTKQIVMMGTAVMATLLALVIMWQFRIVIVYVLISVTLAATLRPFTKRIAGRGIMVRAAWMLVYLAVLAAFSYLLFVAGKVMTNEIQQLGNSVSVQDEWRLPIWLNGSLFQQMLVAQLPPPSKLLEAVIGEQGQLVLPAILGIMQGMAGFVSDMLVILLLSIYWSTNQTHFERLWLSLLPAELRKHARDIWRTIESNLGAYIRSEIIQSLLAALLLGFGYWLLGSPYPAPLALIGALAWLVPVVGMILAVILPLLIGLLTSVQLSLFTTLYTLVILITLQVWVEPRLFRRKWDNPILTLVVLLAMADAFGLVGILIAPPLSAVFQILWSLLSSNRLASGAATQISDLKERQGHLWTAIGEMDEPHPGLVISSMGRLTALIEKAEPILQATLPTEPAPLFHPSQPLAGENSLPLSTKPE
ncbi:MAG: AI-2E family transporter [Chloroflexota bacterium]